MARLRRQSLECHNCNKVVEFTIDLDLDGNHVFECPNCKHEHCRVVKKGKITDVRWDQRNGPTYQCTYVTYTSATTSTAFVYSYNIDTCTTGTY